MNIVETSRSNVGKSREENLFSFTVGMLRFGMSQPHVSIPLSRGLSAIVDQADVALIAGRKWYANPGGRTHYALRDEWRDGRNVRLSMHRVITGAAADQVVDHINGNGLDNRRANLRICSHAENIAAKQRNKNNALGVKGVWFQAGRYRACIQTNGRTRHLGSFITLDEAKAAYADAATEAFGQFAKTS